VSLTNQIKKYLQFLKIAPNFQTKKAQKCNKIAKGDPNNIPFENLIQKFLNFFFHEPPKILWIKVQKLPKSQKPRAT
jgi:hypothetical protein